jgi:glutathione peroxidase
VGSAIRVEAAGVCGSLVGTNPGITFEVFFSTVAGSGAAFPGDISWNFNKFLVGRDGKVVARFDSGAEPDSASLVAAIEAALSAK